MTDLGVAHLAGREPHGLAGRRERPMWVARTERIEHRRVGELDGVARPRWREPPAVEDDQDDGPQATSAPALQIASNEGKSSDAPPTSAPSTSGSERSVAALPGFTEPP